MALTASVAPVPSERLRRVAAEPSSPTTPTGLALREIGDELVSVSTPEVWTATGLPLPIVNRHAPDAPADRRIPTASRVPSRPL